jgi:hypothetical protein
MTGSMSRERDRVDHEAARSSSIRPPGRLVRSSPGPTRCWAPCPRRSAGTPGTDRLPGGLVTYTAPCVLYFATGAVTGTALLKSVSVSVF